jgi:hypothetical protein
MTPEVFTKIFHNIWLLPLLALLGCTNKPIDTSDYKTLFTSTGGEITDAYCVDIKPVPVISKDKLTAACESGGIEITLSYTGITGATTKFPESRTNKGYLSGNVLISGTPPPKK